MSSAWSLTITCLSAMTDSDQRFVIIWLQTAHIADYSRLARVRNGHHAGHRSAGSGPDQDQFRFFKGRHLLRYPRYSPGSGPAAWSASVGRWRLSRPRRAASPAGLGGACGCRRDGAGMSRGQDVMSSSAGTGMTRLGIL
jgi:hypothetical protein